MRKSEKAAASIGASQIAALGRRTSGVQPGAGGAVPTTMTIEEALAVAALLVVRHGDAHMPVLERLQREYEEEQMRQSGRDRAQQILDGLMRKRAVAGPASAAQRRG